MAGASDDAPAADATEGFTDLADAFIRVANEALPAEGPAEVAAAFLYACARYNAFTMQAQGSTPGEMPEETIAYLVGDFASKLGEHMAVRVTSAPGAGGPPAENPVRAAVRAMNDFDDGEWSEFYDLADSFIHEANGLVRQKCPSRVSAALMYGCARFCAFALQVAGYATGAVDEAARAELRDLYEGMLRSHARELLIRPDA